MSRLPVPMTVGTLHPSSLPRLAPARLGLLDLKKRILPDLGGCISHCICAHDFLHLVRHNHRLNPALAKQVLLHRLWIPSTGLRCGRRVHPVHPIDHLLAALLGMQRLQLAPGALLGNLLPQLLGLSVLLDRRLLLQPDLLLVPHERGMP